MSKVANADIVPNKITITAGGEAALDLILQVYLALLVLYPHSFQSICEPGDAIAVIKPFYFGFGHIARQRHLDLIQIDVIFTAILFPDPNREQDWNQFDAVDGCVALIFSNPDVPTGRCFSRYGITVCENSKLMPCVDPIWRRW